MDTVLKVNNLRKTYGRVTALDHLSLEIKKGQVFGLLGPNGSGKTTTLSIILDVIKPDKGDFKWFDHSDMQNARRSIGALLEKPNFYPYLSARDNLKITALIKEVDAPRIDELLQYVGLGQRMNSKVKTFSTGMKQRLALASSLISDPEVLILDEPTNGLDPSGIADVRNLIIEISKTGKTIILASHLLDEVEKVCTHVAVLKSGKLLDQRKLKQEDEANREFQLEMSSENIDQLKNWIKENESLELLDSNSDKCLVKSSLSSAEVNRKLAEAGIYLGHLTIKKKTLEEEFLEITK